jgi:integrase
VKQLGYQLRDRLTPKGTTLALATLRTILQHAVDEDILPNNPAVRIEAHLPKRPTPSVSRFLTQEELSSLLAVIQTHRPTYYPLFLTLARTGMRVGEVLALQWSDIDWRSQTMHVQRNYSGRTIGTPKNGRTRRVICRPS